MSRTHLRGLAVGLGSALLTFLIGCSGDASPPEAQSDPRLADLSDFIRASFEDWNVPGLAVAVVVDDALVFAEGFGVKQVGRTDPITPATLFQIGSVSKGFAAAAIGLLVDQGLVQWDDPLVSHLPWFELADPERARTITIRDLLSHRSGVPEDYCPALEVLSAREVAEHIAPLENFGAYGEYRYSNAGYGLLSLVVEGVTGEPWGSWVQENLLAPLGMHESRTSPYGVWERDFVAPTFLGSAPAGAVSIDDAPTKNVAMPHGFDRAGERRVLPWQSYDNMQGAGSVVSSVVEMANWLRMHLADGRLAGREVLSEETVAELHSGVLSTDGYFLFADEVSSEVALGWMVGSFEGRRYLSHGGGIFGFPAYVGILPELRAGVVVLVNGSMWTPYYPHQEIVAFALSKLLELPTDEIHATSLAQTTAIHERVDGALHALEQQRNEDAPPSLPLAGYVGSYTSAEALSITVTEEDGALRLAFAAPGSFSGVLEAYNGDTFLLRYDGGDGQAFAQSPASFSVSAEGVDGVDLGNLGRFQRQ